MNLALCSEELQVDCVPADLLAAYCHICRLFGAILPECWGCCDEVHRARKGFADERRQGRIQLQRSNSREGEQEKDYTK